MSASGCGCRQGAVMYVVWFAMGALVCYTALQLAATPPGSGGGATAALQPHGNRHHAVPCPPPRQPGAERKNLVFAAVGDGWTADKWSFSDQAGWDLMAVYYGNSTDWDCPQCTLALRMPDAMKWQMVWALMAEKDASLKEIWKGLRQQYEYVMVTDDDLIMDACVIDTFFDTMRRHKLLVAQPSNCRGDDSDNPYWVHWQVPGMELHYVNVVEVTAPGLDMRFLDTKVRPLLENTFSGTRFSGGVLPGVSMRCLDNTVWLLLEHTLSGWGLPYCFTAAAGFPLAKLAAVDSVCMIHPAREPVGEKMTVSERIRRGLIKPGSIYARFGELTPFESPIEEQRSQWKDCGNTEPAAHKARQAWPPTQTIHGMVPAEGKQQAQHAAAVAAGPVASQGLWPAAGQQFMALAGGEQPLRGTLIHVARLAMAAAAGAGAALYCSSRRGKVGSAGSGLLPRAVVSVHASPRR